MSNSNKQKKFPNNKWDKIGMEIEAEPTAACNGAPIRYV